MKTKIHIASCSFGIELDNYIETALIHGIERQIEQKTAELNELKKHIIL